MTAIVPVPPLLSHSAMYHTILYYTILDYTVLYYTVLYYTILYYTILYYTYTELHGACAGFGSNVRFSGADVYSPGKQSGAPAVGSGGLPLPEAPGGLAGRPAGSGCLLCLLAQKRGAGLFLAGSLLLPSGTVSKDLEYTTYCLFLLCLPQKNTLTHALIDNCAFSHEDGGCFS